MESTMQEDEGSIYSNDEEYFLDVCRGGQLLQLQQFYESLPSDSKFDWSCITNSQDNFLHMLAANNLIHLFDYLYPLLLDKLGQQKMQAILNQQNSTGNTPLHYSVITNSKDMMLRLIQINADTSLLNQFNRTAFAEAEEFDKFDLAEILAPITKQDIEELKKQFGQLDVCNEDSSEEEEEGQQPKQEQRQQKYEDDKEQQ